MQQSFALVEVRPAREKKQHTEEPEDHALGRSRGGFSTKLHVVTDSNGIPLALHVSPGQRSETQCMETVLEKVKIKHAGPGRPTTRPQAIVGDKGYNSKQLRNYLRSRGIRPVIPTYKNQKPDPAFDRKLYRKRNVVERSIGWLKNFRRVATRYEKLAICYLAMTKLAAIRLIFNRIDSSNTT